TPSIGAAQTSCLGASCTLTQRRTIAASHEPRRAKSGLRPWGRTAPNAGRPLRTGDHVSARLRDRSLRLSVRLLHVGAHDVPAQGRPALARRTRPAVQRVYRARRQEAKAHRRRTAGAARDYGALRFALPAFIEPSPLRA